MNFLIVGLKNGSQIIRLQEEAQKLGHFVTGCMTSDLVIRSESGKFGAYIGDKSLTEFDLIYLCAGIESGGRFEWYVAVDYLKQNSKTKIVNEVVVDPLKKYYPLQTWFYLKQFEGDIPQPVTFSVFNAKAVENISKEIGFPLIVKISETHQGSGVFLANSIAEIKEIMFKNGDKTYLIRKFIANDGDVRIFVIGGTALGAMKRIPPGGEFRSNISVGGIGESFDLESNPKIKALAEKVASVSGIEIAGVDIIIDKTSGEPYVLEVNVGPQFNGFEKYTKTNVAAKIVDYFISKCK